MHFRSRTGIALACAVALVALVGVVSTASAGKGKKLKTAEASTTVPPPSPSGVVFGTAAKCKKKTKAVSGGWSSAIDLEAPDFELIDVARSLREGKRSWRMEGLNFGDTETELTVYAYCRKQKLKTKTKTTTIGAAPGASDPAQQSLSVKCPKGTKVVSGGVSFSDADPGTFLFLATESRRLNRRTWSGAGLNLGSSAGDLIAQANCAKGKALKEREASFTFESNSIQTVEAKCRKSERVVSGGFAAEDTGIVGSGIFLASFRKQGRRTWIGEAYGTGSPAPTLTISAYCEKKKKKK